jgi:hypothetical protein
MEIIYTAHAVERMMQRVVSPQEVELLLGDPDGIIAQSKDKFIYYKMIRGRKDNDLAAVVVQKRNNLHEVITVMVNFEAPK